MKVTALFVILLAAGVTLKVSGDIVIPAGTVSEGTAVALNGNIRVHGTLQGDALAFNGDIEVTGRITGSARALNGNVIVRRSGSIGEDASAANGKVEVERDGRVGGRITQGTLSPVASPSPAAVPSPGTSPAPTPAPPVAAPTPEPSDPFGLRRFPEEFAWWARMTGWELIVKTGFVLTMLVLAAGLAILFPGPLREVARALAAWPLQSLVLGFAWWAALFIGSLVLAVTIIGLPVLVLVPALVTLVALAGFAGVALLLGRRIRGGTSRETAEAAVGAVLLGLLVFIPWLGGVLLGLAITWGIGAVLAAVAARLRPGVFPAPS